MVEGRDGAAIDVLEALHRQKVAPAGLRVVDGTLDSAYLQLTDNQIDSEISEEQLA